MTEHEIRLARALGACGFPAGHPHKRFCRDMASLAAHSPDKDLSDRQRAYMDHMAWRYRRQMPLSLVPDGKPPDLPPATKKTKPSKGGRIDPVPTQGQMLFISKLPPVFRREIDL